VAIRVSQGGLPNAPCNADRGVALKVKEVKLRHLEDLSRFAHKGVSLPPRVPPPPAILTMVLHSLTLLRVSVLHSLAATRELFRAIVWHCPHSAPGWPGTRLLLCQLHPIIFDQLNLIILVFH